MDANCKPAKGMGAIRRMAKPTMHMADGGAVSPYSIRGLYQRAVTGATDLMEKVAPIQSATERYNAAHPPAPAAPTAPAPATTAISDYAGMGAMKRREVAAGLKDGGELESRKEDKGEGGEANELQTGKGGAVPGKGKGDKIPAKYEPGEFVVSNAMLKKSPGLLKMLHNLRNQTLAEQGKTPAQANAGRFKGGAIRALNGLDPILDGFDVRERPWNGSQDARTFATQPGPGNPNVGAAGSAEARAFRAAQAGSAIIPETATAARAVPNTAVGRILTPIATKAGKVIASPVGRLAGAGAVVLPHFNDYKLDDGYADSSAGGTIKALREGDFSGAGRSLSKGALETGMDLGSAGANLLDYVVPGKAPVSSAYDRMLRNNFGDQLNPAPGVGEQPATYVPAPPSQATPAPARGPIASIAPQAQSANQRFGAFAPATMQDAGPVSEEQRVASGRAVGAQDRMLADQLAADNAKVTGYSATIGDPAAEQRARDKWSAEVTLSSITATPAQKAAATQALQSLNSRESAAENNVSATQRAGMTDATTRRGQDIQAAGQGAISKLARDKLNQDATGVNLDNAGKKRVADAQGKLLDPNATELERVNARETLRALLGKDREFPNKFTVVRGAKNSDGTQDADTVLDSEGKVIDISGQKSPTQAAVSVGASYKGPDGSYPYKGKTVTVKGGKITEIK